MLKIEMLPAGHGDALLIEYRRPPGPTRRVLIDGGPWYAYKRVLERLEAIPEEERELELLIVTHIDSDHIDGVIRLLHEPSRPFRFKDIWFNGRKHLDQVPTGLLAGQQGEYLGALIERDGLPWNRAFGGGPVTVGTVEGAPRGPISLEDGLRVTVLSPTRQALLDLLPEWDKAVRKAGFEPGDRDAALEQLARRARYKPVAILGAAEDHSKANGSSIAVLLEFEGRRALMAGDAWPSHLEQALDSLPAPRPKIHAFKLAHHGGFGNISRGLIERARADRYLISTNGSYYKHPHDETIELILRNHPGEIASLAFNYASRTTEPFLDPDRQARRGYEARSVAGESLDV